MSVIIADNIKKEKAFIDTEGNIINQRTKQIIEKNEVESVLNTPEQPAPTPQPTSGLTIQQQIDEAKQNLAQLEELKKLKIAQMKAEIELLEQ